MPVRLDKAWMPIEQALTRLHGHLGVFQLGNANGEVIYIGFAGGKSQYGIRAEVADAAERMPQAVSVRYEITTAYMSRFRELMMVHVADFGSRPIENPPISLGKLSPA